MVAHWSGRPGDGRVACKMPNLTQAELLFDLERQQGTLFQRTMLQLLSRGRSGIRQVAARLGGPLDARLDAALKASGRQVIEMVARAGAVNEESGIALLGRLEPRDLVDKASELWERGEREEARAMVGRLGAATAGSGSLYLMKARIALADGSLDDALALYAKASQSGLHARGILEGASLASENGRLDDAATILGYASGDGPDPLSSLAGDVLHRALQSDDEQLLVSCCGSLAARSREFLAASLLAAVAAIRRLNQDTIRDMQEHLSALSTVLSKASLDARSLLNEAPPAGEVMRRVDASLAEFEGLATHLSDALDAGLWASGAHSELGRLGTALLNVPGAPGLVALQIQQAGSGAEGRVSAASLRQAAASEVESTLRERWIRTREAVSTSLSSCRALRDLAVQGASGMPRAALFGRVSIDLSFMNAWLDDAGLHLAIREGAPERYELLTGVLEDSFRSAQALARDRETGLSADIQRDLPRLRIVRLEISHAVSNLLGVAIRQAAPGTVVLLSARMLSRGSGVEISIKSDAISIPPGLRTLEQVLSKHHWKIPQPVDASHQPVLAIHVPESSEEDVLRTEVEGYDELEAGTKQALRAAEALGGAPESASLATFLYSKALEIEIPAVLLPGLERHALLPGALALKNDPQAFAEAVRAVAAVTGTPERETLKRSTEVVDAVVRNRLQKEISDWRSLAIALALFRVPGAGRHPGGGNDDLLKALYRAEQVRDTSRAGGSQSGTARPLCLEVLSGLSRIKAEKVGRRPPQLGQS